MASTSILGQVTACTSLKDRKQSVAMLQSLLSGFPCLKSCVSATLLYLNATKDHHLDMQSVRGMPTASCRMQLCQQSRSRSLQMPALYSGSKRSWIQGATDVGLPGAGSGDPWNGGICLRGHGGQPAERRKACLPALTRENTVTRTVGPKTCIPIYKNMGTVSQETLLQIRRTHAVVVFQAHRIPNWW